MLRAFDRINIVGGRRVARLSVLGLVMVCLLLLEPGVAAPPDTTVGPYRLIFRGCYSGDGTGVVNANNVMIRGNLLDENGNRVNFVAPSLTIENHRFHDQVTVAGRTIKVNGRVDPAGGPLKKARLVCTFSVVGVGHGRVAGEHN